MLRRVLVGLLLRLEWSRAFAPITWLAHTEIFASCAAASPRKPPSRSCSFRLWQTELDSDSFQLQLQQGTPDLSPWIVAVLALALGVAAQGFINQMLEGDQGLGAFLRDGKGYNRSGFRQSAGNSSTDKMSDPLPWLKLPRLDFVEVAGQDSQTYGEKEDLTVLYQKLEDLRVDMTEKLNEGKEEEAAALRQELELVMEQSGIEYQTDADHD